MLVLDDDPAVDATKEHEIRAASARRGRTTLVIAHRPATIALADRVAVLEGGRIVELDTHEAPLRHSACYRALLALEEWPYDGARSTREVWWESQPFRGPVAPPRAAVAVIVSTLITLVGRRSSSTRSTTAFQERPAAAEHAAALLGLAVLEAARRPRADAAGRDRERDVPRPLARAAFDKLQALPLGFFEQERTGVLVSRPTSDVQALDEFLREALVEVVGSGLQIALTVVVLVFLSPKLALVSLVRRRS